MSNPCTKEGELGKIEQYIDLLTKEIFGNGQKGLIRTIPRLESKVDDVLLNQSDMRITISALVKFQTEIVSIETFKAKARARALQRTAVIVSSILSFGGIIVTLIIKLV